LANVKIYTITSVEFLPSYLSVILYLTKIVMAKYQGRTVTLNKIMRSDRPSKKSMVYVKKPDGKIKKVHFGDPNMTIKKNIPERRRSFRARHNCDNPGPRWKPRYWACKTW